jgi:2-polyprenyl-3-methyl-5-hydroxy-6-metoxy-1,4-benzoquinol methylase
VTHGAREHWNTLYGTKAADKLSWFQAWPQISLRLLSSVGSPSSAVLDIGGGASTLCDALLTAGWSDVTVLDVSTEALGIVGDRLGHRRNDVSLITADVLSWQPQRTYDVWHDRAVFHFLVEPDEQQQYVATATNAVAVGGFVIMGTFAADGPTHCSGLPTARYPAEGLSAMFEPAFQLMHAEREEHVTPRGVSQPFTWVVLRHA